MTHEPVTKIFYHHVPFSDSSSKLLLRKLVCLYCAVELDKSPLIAFMRHPTLASLLFGLLISMCAFVPHPPLSPSLFLLSILQILLRSLSFHQGPNQLELLIWCDSHIYFSARITVALRSTLHASLHRWAVTYRKETARLITRFMPHILLVMEISETVCKDDCKIITQIKEFSPLDLIWGELCDDIPI